MKGLRRLRFFIFLSVFNAINALAVMGSRYGTGVLCASPSPPLRVSQKSSKSFFLCRLNNSINFLRHSEASTEKNK
jgi:hypothetical protein